ncbi:MAG: GT-D fold domain-containing glycosyltransferase [Cyclobacteriaceae bacterium]|nr:GT-D fold domain-containing glycosyltransferase [Cyclobacteriaceae bacterium]
MNIIYPLLKSTMPFPKVKSIDETINEIVQNKSSISRYGDGEFLFIIDKIDLAFQNYDNQLRARLIEVLSSNLKNHLVGIPIGYNTLDNLIPDSKIFWKSQIVWIYPRLRKYLSIKKQYFNASMTRIYVTFEDKSHCGVLFGKLMKIWEGRDVLLIEGEKSRLGVGNDLFSKSNSLNRILAPMHHAFSKYDEIVDEVKKYSSDYLILIALGPTATILAYDLHKLGYQAVDVGNVDIEYEWFLQKADAKVKIKGKYTSEAAGGRIVQDIDNPIYHAQVVKRII